MEPHDDRRVPLGRAYLRVGVPALLVALSTGVRHGARTAALLRGALGLLTVTLVVLGAFLAT